MTVRRITEFTEVEVTVNSRVGTGFRALLSRRRLLRAGPRLTAAFVLSAVIVVLMVVQAVLGLAVPDLYPEEPWAVAALRGNDLVTLALVAPALAVSVYLSRTRPSTPSVAVWLGLLFYGVYNYAYYAFGAAFSAVFLLHVAAFSLSVFALVLLGTSIDADSIAVGVRGGTWARVVAVFTALVGLALIVAWGTMSIRYAFTGQLPEDVMPPAAVHLVYALDMGVLAPVFIVAGVLLWLRLPWGAVMAAAVNVSGAAYLAVLEFVGGFQSDAGIPGATWASPDAIGATLLCLAAALVLLLPGRRVDA